jgi:hypothetical protein
VSSPLALREDLVEVARRCVWYQKPDETLTDENFFIAHVMTYGAPFDVKILRHHFSKEDLTTALINAPPGIIDARSWAYWNLMLRDLSPPPPMPTRTFPDETKT